MGRSRFANLNSEVFEDSREVDKGAKSDMLGISTNFKELGDSTNCEGVYYFGLNIMLVPKVYSLSAISL